MRPPQEKATKLRNSYPAHHPVYKDDGGGGDIPVPVPVAMGGTGATSSASARQNLGLGSIATRDAGTGADDFRDNAENDARFMQPGAFGVGAMGIATPATLDFNDVAQPNGFYRWGPGTANNPASGGGGAIKFTRSDQSAAWLASRSAGNPGNNTPQFFVKTTSATLNDWGDWEELYHTGNLSPVQTTGDQDIGGVKTFLDGLSIAMAEPQWAMTDTSDGNKAVAIALLGNQFLIAADRNGDGNVEGPIALLLNSDNNTVQLYGSLAYTRANILGTVSQSGGVPTGEIIERGGNANGEYVRFADGTQMCWGSDQLNGTNTNIKSFPASFASGLYGLSANILSTTPTPIVAKFGSLNSSGFNIVGVIEGGSFATNHYRWQAIGRWI